MFERIDSLLLNWLGKFSGWFQKMTGKNCFWLSRIFLVWGGMNFFGIWQTDVIDALMNKGYNGARGLAWPIFLSCLVIVSTTGLWFISKYDEKRALRHIEQGYMNPFKLSHYHFRLFSFSVFVFAVCLSVSLFWKPSAANALGVFFGVNGWLGNVLHDYFMACNLLPPSKSKIKELREKFSAFVRNIFSPFPTPAPVPIKYKSHRGG